MPYLAEKGDVATAITYPDRKGFAAPEKSRDGKARLPDPADTAHRNVPRVWPLHSDCIRIA